MLKLRISCADVRTHACFTLKARLYHYTTVIVPRVIVIYARIGTLGRGSVRKKYPALESIFFVTVSEGNCYILRQTRTVLIAHNCYKLERHTETFYPHIGE